MVFLSESSSTLGTQAQIFPIGGVLGVMGLFFTAVGLINPRLELKIKLRPVLSKVIVIVFFIGCLVALSASFVVPAQSLFGIKADSILGKILLLPNTLELAGGAIIVLAIGLFLWLWYNDLPLFSSKNHMNYAKKVLFVIAANKNLNTLLEELAEVAESIVSNASKYKEPRTTSESEEEVKQNEVATSGLAILDALSDQDVSNLMATSCPRTGLVFLKCLKKYKCAEKRIGHSFVEGLSRASLMNENSILSRERDFEGLGFFKNFTKTLYGDAYFVNAYDTLDAWKSYERQDVSKLTVENYCKALREALTLEEINGHTVSKGIEKLVSPISKITKSFEDKGWRYDCEESEMLTEIMRTLENSIASMEEKEAGVPIPEEDHIPMKNGKYDQFADYSIYGGWAQGLFEIFDQLCWATKGNDDFIRTQSIRLWMAVFQNFESSSLFLQRVAKRLWLMMKERIIANMTEKAYPRMTRLVLNYEGHMIIFGRDKKWLANFPNREFLEIFVKNFQNCFDDDPEYAKGLLPEGIEFNEADTTFMRETRRSKKKEVISLKELAESL